ncbi:MAG: hypothetical protein NQ127_00500 [Candidatus Cardinium sp.]|nr:hypothetical protein [Candidatus Cardinium sp.]
MHKYKLSRRNIISKSSLCLVALAVTGCQNQSDLGATFVKIPERPLDRIIKQEGAIKQAKQEIEEAQPEMSVLAEIAEEKSKKAREIKMKMAREIVEASKEGRSINQRRIAEMGEEAEMTARVAREAREEWERRTERVNAAKRALEEASKAKMEARKIDIAKIKKAQEERMARKKREKWEANMKAENERIAAVVTEAKIKTAKEMKMIAGEEMKRQKLTETGVEVTEEAVQKMLNKPNLPLKTAKKISGCLFKVFKKIFHKKEQQQLGLGTTRS